MNLSIWDALIFFGYFIGVVVFAVVVAARSKTKSSADYFLASKKLPWYAIGASFIASNISTEHFIGMVGWGFLYGMAVANWEWANAATFTALIWIFLPFYMRGNVATMPEFLEKRFNKTCRYIYAVVMIIGLVIAMLGGVMFAGAKAMNVFFPQIPIWMGILILAVSAGTYTIYGGLLSAVWADVLQFCLLMVGGIIVSVYGVYHAGGLDQLMDSMPEKFIMFYSSRHEMIPWTGFISGLVSVGLWYNCANQFMVQRCLGARSEWDARMGVIMAGFSKAILPFIVVIPGIAAFYLFQSRISDGDQAWPFMVKQFLPAGLIGLVLAGLASAVMSTLSAITNSSSTIFTLDLYKELIRPNATDKELHIVGRLSALVIILVGISVALVIAAFPGITVFQLIQTVFFYVAPPIAACFLLGIMWKRITAVAATLTMLLGFLVLLPTVIFVLFPKVPFLQPYDNFMHHTFAVFVLSCVILVILSLFSKPKPEEELEGVIWTKSALGVAEAEKGKYGGFRSLKLWWFLMAATIGGLYVYTNSQGSNTAWLEAEAVTYAVGEGLSVKVQPRSDIPPEEKFNLWTGHGQVLFEPAQSGQSVTFEVPVESTGLHKVDALVTVGPGYGAFGVEIDGKPATISFPDVRLSEEGVYSSETVERGTFDAVEVTREREVNGIKDSIAGAYTVQRISLGVHESTGQTITIAFISKDVRDEGAAIGIDQFIVTKE
ncbi:MAG: sodium/solute symporter [Verrucomicrobia bacterium]|jgi:solute:Na+ symporter, SSS family|nr:sodium/solute symporter [Verrucomicrobiota bacterium]